MYTLAGSIDSHYKLEKLSIKCYSIYFRSGQSSVLLPSSKCRRAVLQGGGANSCHTLSTGRGRWWLLGGRARWANWGFPITAGGVSSWQRREGGGGKRGEASPYCDTTSLLSPHPNPHSFWWWFCKPSNSPMWCGRQTAICFHRRVNDFGSWSQRPHPSRDPQWPHKTMSGTASSANELKLGWASQEKVTSS